MCMFHAGEYILCKDAMGTGMRPFQNKEEICDTRGAQDSRKKKTQALNHTVDGSKILLGGFYLINYKDVKKSQLVQVFFHQYLNQPAMTYLPTNLKNNNGAIFAKVDYQDVPLNWDLMVSDCTKATCAWST